MAGSRQRLGEEGWSQAAPSALERWSPNHKFVSAKRLSEGFNQPFEAYEPGVCDQYMIGFTNQISQVKISIEKT